jgi:hypothetical protein
VAAAIAALLPTGRAADVLAGIARPLAARV